MIAILEPIMVSFATTIIVTEMAIASPLVKLTGTLLRQSKKSMVLIGNANISDHWKERALPAYALRIMRDSILILVWLMALLAVYAAGIYVSAWALAGNFEGIEAIQRVDYMFFSFLIAMAYLGVRRMLRHA